MKILAFCSSAPFAQIRIADARMLFSLSLFEQVPWPPRFSTNIAGSDYNRINSELRIALYHNEERETESERGKMQSLLVALVFGQLFVVSISQELLLVRMNLRRLSLKCVG